MKYESNILERLIKTYGVVGNPKYVSEIIKQFIIQGKECYPNLFTYQSDWLAHIDEFGLANDYVVTYTGQRFYAPNTKESPVKRAILKGQTLVNVDSCYAINDFKWSNISNIDNDGFITINANGGYVNAFTGLKPLIKPNTKYLAIVDIKENTIDGKLCLFSQHNGESIFSKQGVQVSAGTTGMLKYILTSDSEFTSDTNIALRNYLDGSSTQGSVIYRTMLIEYIDGMENWDIPFFRGMQSVKLPVLKTTGKNLFDVSSFVKGVMEKQYYSQNGDKLQINALDARFGSNYVSYKVKKGEILTISTNPKVPIRIFDIKNNIMHNSSTDGILTYTAETDNEIGFKFIANEYPTLINVQLEKGTVATPYEPYKTNILTCNEEVTLRGVGNVKDELNLLTGEVVERIGEVVLDGSQGFTLTGTPNQVDTLCILFHGFPKIANGAVMSDKLITESNYDYSDFECITQNKYGIGIRLLRNKLESVDINGVKKFLSQNPITVQYQLATESIKTVDLNIKDHNQQKVERLTSFEGGTHFDTSSQTGSVLPTLEVDVVVDLEETLMTCSTEGNTM